MELLIRQAVGLHQQGKLVEAELLYREALRADPISFTARHLLGLLRHQQGRSDEAVELIGAALETRPDDFNALSNYAMALMAIGRLDEALARYEQVLMLQPDFIEALYNRGVILWQLKRPAEALASYEDVLALRPDHAGTLYNQAVVLTDLKRPEAALDRYDRTLAIQPDFVMALENRGALLLQLKRFDDALASYEKILAFAPQDAMAWNNRGVALRLLKRFEAALASFDKAIALKSGFAAAWANRGLALKDMARLPGALASYDRALAIDPGNEVAWNSRGNVLRDLQRPEEALASYSKAIALKPDYAEALNNRGYMQWSDFGRYESAILDLESALTVDPDYDYARGELLHIRMHVADWRDFDREAALLDTGVRDGRRVVRPFAYQALSQSSADLQACSRIFAGDQFPAMPAMPVHPAQGGGKIRIGYVSADFREQATAYLMAGLYELHDRQRFEIVAFDNRGGDASPIRQRLEAAFDRFVDISTLSDQAAAERIRAENIDILVNLNGYFGAPRMGVFALRPAPVQISYLGFPATLGAPYIDYIIADRIVIPDGERRYYDERIVYLPGSYQVNDSRRGIAGETASRAASGLPDGAFVFCNFNQGYKLTPAIFGLWMRILRQIEGSVLWLLEGHPLFRENLTRAAEHHGMAPARLIFAPPIVVEKHLARLRLADLFLDSLPYTAHTTASDALWAGLPLLTCRGTAFPGRVAASLLNAADMPELVTETLADYEALAVALAGDSARLRALRKRLTENRDNCPLFDTDRTRRHIEAAYTTMWEIAQRGDTPRSFSVGTP